MTPPFALHDADAEQAVLGSVMLSPECVAGVRQLVEVGDFYAPAHRDIWQAITALVDEGRAPDGVTVSARLAEMGALDRVGGAGYLVDIWERVPSAANAQMYAEIVRDRAVRRLLAEGARALELEAGDGLTEPAEAICTARERLDAAVARLEGLHDFDLGAAVDDALASLSDDSNLRRWPTGVPALDDLTGGFSPGQHWVVGGRSQHAKTALACNMMLECLRQGGSVLCARYEETVRQVLFRLASLVSRIPYSEANMRRLNEHEAARFRDGLDSLRADYGGRLHVIVGAEVAQVEALVARVRPWLVVYDTLQAMALQVGGQHERHDLNVGVICGSVSRLALKYGHAAVLISQLSKGAHGLPTMRDLRESGAIEEAADVAALCWWPHVEVGEAADAGRYVLRIGKNRAGSLCPTTVSRIIPATQQVCERLSAEDAHAFLDTVT